jgi:VWFA-related protein
VLRLRSLSLLVGSMLILAEAAAGQKPEPSPGSPLFRTQANLVLVDVVVTSHGQPVVGLKEPGFRIYDQGQEQKLTVFEEHRATDAIQAAPVPKLPPGVYSNYPQFTETSAADVLLLDALNTPLGDQKYVRLQMLKFLTTIPPGTRIAVFTLASKLEMITGFTTDAIAIAKALGPGRGNAQKSPVMDPDADRSLRDLAKIEEANGCACAQGLYGFASETASFEVGLRMRMTMDAFQELARYLMTIPGRKNLMWFSGSFPGVVGPDARAAQAGMPDQAQRDFLAAVMRTDNLLTLARVAVYPIDALGLLNVPSVDAAEFISPANSMGSHVVGSDPTGQTGPAGGPPVPDSSNAPETVGETDREMINEMFSEHITMDQIARDTGGKAFYNTNGLGDAMVDAIANGSNYYTLGYVPTNKDDNGAFRRIRVQVEGQHYTLQYRQGYYADSPAEEAKRLPTQIHPVVAAMQPGAPPLSQLIFEARVSPAGMEKMAATAPPELVGALARSLRPPLTRYTVDYSIDPRRLGSVTLSSGHHATELELTQVAYSLDGVRMNYTDKVIPVAVHPEEIDGRENGIHLHQEIDLPQGQVLLRLGVADMASGRIGTLQIPLSVTGK